MSKWLDLEQVDDDLFQPQPVHLHRLAVKHGTQLQLSQPGALHDQRRSKLLACATEAHRQGLPGAAAAAACEASAASIALAQRKLWRLQWDNEFKEVYWRFVLNGLPTYARMGSLASQHCLCGEPGPGRLHHYWECPLAAAVVSAVEAHLPQPANLPPGTRALLRPWHVWCMEPPRCRPRVHGGVWRVVCLAALNAMDYGRRKVYALALAAQAAQGQQQRQRQRLLSQGQLQLEDVRVVVRPSPASAALAAQRRSEQLAELQRVVVARFWSLLVDFEVLGTAPPQWQAAAAPNQPFMRPNPTWATVQLQHLQGVLSDDDGC